MLLVQTPRGTVSLPPQGFFQQQPSPFASQLTPTGLPPLRPPVSFAPRTPAPADLNSASLVQPPAPPPATIPSSSSFNTRRRGFGPAENAFEGAPVSNPALPGSVDPATAFSIPAGLAFGPLGGVFGRGFGNAISAFTAPPGALAQVNPLSVLANVFTPFGIAGKSIHEQTQPFKQAVQVLENEFQVQKEQEAKRAFNSRFTRQFGPGVAPAFSVTSPTFGNVNPNVHPSFFGIPEAGDTEGFSGMGEGFGENAANTGQEDVDEDSPDASDGGGGGGSGTYICTAAWHTGISAPATWSLNRRFGVWIRRNDPLAYEGYSVFGPWIADRIRDGKLRWIGKLKPQCWAYEMAQRSGKDTSGFPLSIKIVNRIQRATTRPLVRLLGWYVSK